MSYVAPDHREPTPERQAKVDAQWAEMIKWLGEHKLRMHIPLKGNVWFSRVKPGESP